MQKSQEELDKLRAAAKRPLPQEPAAVKPEPSKSEPIKPESPSIDKEANVLPAASAAEPKPIEKTNSGTTEKETVKEPESVNKEIKEILRLAGQK